MAATRPFQSVLRAATNPFFYQTPVPWASGPIPPSVGCQSCLSEPCLKWQGWEGGSRAPEAILATTPLMDLGGRLPRATAFQSGLKPAGPVEAAHMCIFPNLQIHPPGQGYMVGQAYPLQAPHI